MSRENIAITNNYYTDSYSGFIVSKCFLLVRIIELLVFLEK